jgi:NTE family protein
MASKALVLGGGGETARAWEIGLLWGLADDGLDLRDADLVIGTSVGAILGAQLGAGADLERLFEDELAGAGPGAETRRSRWIAMRLAVECRRTGDPVRHRSRVGALARTAEVPEAVRRLATIRTRLPAREWPSQRLLVAAVDAGSGEFVAFDRDCGVSLTEALAAGNAAPGEWAPVELYGRFWIDGAIRSTTNADLAAGVDRVLVLAPNPSGHGVMPAVADQVARLRDSSKVLLVVPGRAIRRAVRHDPHVHRGRALRASAARAGRLQATQVLPEITRLWHD